MTFCIGGRLSLRQANPIALGASSGALRKPLPLLTDEPFGSLDALTPGQTNVELLPDMEGKSKGHPPNCRSLQEAAFLDHQIVVFSPGLATPGGP